MNVDERMCLHIDGGKNSIGKFREKSSGRCRATVFVRLLRQLANCWNRIILHEEELATRKLSSRWETFHSHARRNANERHKTKHKKNVLYLFNIIYWWRLTSYQFGMVSVCICLNNKHATEVNESPKPYIRTMVVRRSTSSQHLFSTFHLIRIGYESLELCFSLVHRINNTNTSINVLLRGRALGNRYIFMWNVCLRAIYWQHTKHHVRFRVNCVDVVVARRHRQQRILRNAHWILINRAILFYCVFEH